MQTQNQPDVSSLRFIVLQMGARMHYAVPALLARVGILEHFYTDICGNLGLLKTLQFLWPSALQPKPIKRLFGRQLPSEISASSVTTYALETLFSYITLHHLSNLINPAAMLRQRIIKDKFFNGNALYTFINSDLELVRQAKQAGLLVVHEQILNPNVGYILREERSRYPHLEPQDSLEDVEEGVHKDVEQWSLSDLILAPSGFVERTIIELGGDAKRIAIVPYGINEEWLFYQARPQIGRVLFVGTVGLRKGNHYLAEATRVLQKRGVSCQVRVVGPYDSRTIKQPEFQGPAYIGQVPRSEVIKEFLEADIFVLPTLSDSFALVHLEALACGVPVITTPNCGSVVRDGVEGFIISIRNSQLLADRIEQLITDRQLRNTMSYNARQRAKDFTWDSYQKNLLQALMKLEQPQLK